MFFGPILRLGSKEFGPVILPVPDFPRMDLGAAFKFDDIKDEVAALPMQFATKVVVV